MRQEGKGQNSDFKLRLLRKKSDLKGKSINFVESHPLCTLGISFSSNQEQDKEQRGTRIGIQQKEYVQKKEAFVASSKAQLSRAPVFYRNSGTVKLVKLAWLHTAAELESEVVLDS